MTCQEGLLVTMVAMVDDASHGYYKCAPPQASLLLLEAAAAAAVRLMGYVGLCSQPFR
jgi:hypothetical protein